MDNRIIKSDVRLGGRVYKPGMEDELAKSCKPAQLADLAGKGAIEGDWDAVAPTEGNESTSADVSRLEAQLTQAEHENGTLKAKLETAEKKLGDAIEKVKDLTKENGTLKAAATRAAKGGKESEAPKSDAPPADTTPPAV